MGLVTKVKPNINSVEEVHPQLNNNGHPMDDAFMGIGLLKKPMAFFKAHVKNSVG
jgi:hypothetical protein